jgi:hypothetical protein
MGETLNLSSTVKVSDGIVHRDLQGELVLLSLNSGHYFGLDALGTRIWHLLGEGQSLEEVVQILVRDHDVTEAQCRQDLLNLIAEMRDKGLIEVSHGTAS